MRLLHNLSCIQGLQNRTRSVVVSCVRNVATRSSANFWLIADYSVDVCASFALILEDIHLATVSDAAAPYLRVEPYRHRFNRGTEKLRAVAKKKYC